MNLRVKKQSSTSIRQSRVPQNRTVRKEFFSYHTGKQASVDRDNNIRQRLEVSDGNKAWFTWQKAPVILVTVILVISLGYATLLGSDARFKTTKSDVLLRDEETYASATKKILQSSISNKNKLSISTHSIELALLQEFPELSDVAITVPIMGKKPIVELKSEQPELFLANQKGVFVINNEGRVVAKTNQNNGIKDLVLPIVREESNYPIELGKSALTKQEVVFITTLLTQLENKNLEIESLTLPPAASEMHVKIKNLPYYIKFNLLTDARIASGQFIAAKKQFENLNDIPQEYVDVRVEEKVFFK